MNNLLETISKSSNLKQLKITELKTAQEKTKAKSKSSFEATFQFAKLVKESADYFKTKECKENLEKIGIVWKLEDFFNNLGEGFGKQWCYRLIKAVKLEFKTIEKDGKEQKINMFEKYLNSENKYSIVEFIKFASDKKEEKEKEEFKLKLVFNDVKLSINSKDELNTELTKAEIKSIMILLQRKIDTMIEK